MVYAWFLQNILLSHLICVCLLGCFFKGGGALKNVLDDAYNKRHMFTSHQTNDKYANLKLCKSLYILTSSNPICRNIYQQIERYIYSENTLTSEFQNNATFLMGSETIKFILRVLTDFLCVIYCGAFVILIYICHGYYFFYLYYMYL